MTSRLPFAFVLCIAPLLMAERCGPATSLSPAYQAGSVVTDDTLAGDYVAVSIEPDGAREKNAKGWRFPAAHIAREDTEEGPSYVLVLKNTAELKDVRLRMFLFELGGARFVDMVAEDASASGAFAKSLALPQHMLFRITRGSGASVSLDYLDAKWVDAEALRDPKGVPMRSVPRQFRKKDGAVLEPDREPVLVGDTAAIRALLARAATVPGAWSVGVELTRKGAPVLRFTVTTDERTGEAVSAPVRYSVMGSRLEIEREVARPGEKAPERLVARKALLDPIALEARLSAFERAPRTKPKTPTAAAARVRRICVERAGATVRCVERVEGDDSGADLIAARALVDALKGEAAPAP